MQINVANPRRRRIGKPKLPWKRGPVAWEIAKRSSDILDTLNGHPRQFFSLRKASAILGISTQPLRDWVRLGCICRNGPRQQFPKGELCRFVSMLIERAESYDMASRVERFERDVGHPRRPFAKLQAAKFVWPKGRKTLTPKEISILTNCHPSLVIKAIRKMWRLGSRRTPHRWQISRYSWNNNFYFTLIEKPRMPPLRRAEIIPTREAADYLRNCGALGMNLRGIVSLIKNGQLEGVHQTPRGRKWYVKRASLIKFAENFKKPIDTL